jgi:hypothetical protein
MAKDADAAKYNIVFQVEGLDSENGHVRLDSLLSQLKALEESLQSVERLVDDKDQATIYYRVVDASHSSPIRFVLEPVLKPRNRAPVTDSLGLLKKHHDRFFVEIGRISRKEAPSPDVSDKTLQTIQKLVNQQGKEFKTATITNGSAKVQLDAKLKQNVNYFLTEEISSYGSYQGTLEAVNIHGETNTFWIYPATGTNRIRCKFPVGTKERVKRALDKLVIVSGKKFYRPKSNFPHRIDVAEFEIVEQAPKHLKDLKGTLATNGITGTSEQIINQVRDEWE